MVTTPQQTAKIVQQLDQVLLPYDEDEQFVSTVTILAVKLSHMAELDRSEYLRLVSRVIVSLLDYDSGAFENFQAQQEKKEKN